MLDFLQLQEQLVGMLIWTTTELMAPIAQDGLHLGSIEPCQKMPRRKGRGILDNMTINRPWPEQTLSRHSGNPGMNKKHLKGKHRMLEASGDQYRFNFFGYANGHVRIPE